MTERPRGWNKYEAAILLEGLLEVLDNGASRKEIIKRVSCDLRKMACQQGEEINEVFRNENGIFFQMESMESALKGYTATKKPATKLFTQVVNLYKTDRLEYDRILREARAMINKEQSCEADFMSWLSTKVSSAQLSELYWCYTEIESVGIKARILSSPLFETTDAETISSVHRYIEQDKFFRLRHFRQYSKLLSASRYYLTYITEMTAQSAEEVQSTVSPPIFIEAIAVEETATPATQKGDTTPQLETLMADEDTNPGEKGCITEREALSPAQSEIIMETSSVKEISALEPQSEVTPVTAPQTDEFTSNIDTSPGDKGLESEALAVDFDKLGNYRHTKPCYFSYFEENKAPCSSWTELYVTFFATLEEDYPHLFHSGMSFSADGRSVDLETRAKRTLLFSPRAVPGTDYVVETNIGATKMVWRMKYILDFCAVDYENIVIKYRRKPPREKKIRTVSVQQEVLLQQSSMTERLNQPKISAAMPVYTSVRASVTGGESENCSKLDELYVDVLRENFRRGFRLDSAIEVRRFRKSYQFVHGTELKDSDDKIVDIIRRLCIQCKDRCYLPDAMLSEELREKLFTYIENSFSGGKTTIYFQAICTEFAEDFLDYPLHNDPEALKAYLISVGNGRFYINRSSISKEANVITDPLTEIRTCLQEYSRPVKYEELFAALSHLPQSKIKMLLATNGEFISNGQGAYFHESAVQLSEEELENIAQIIEQTIADKDFIGGNELYEAIQAKYPYIIENNFEFSVYGFRDALKYKFGNRFSFRGNIISAAGKERSMTDVFANYARKHDSFTLAELEMLAADLASPIYFDAVYKNSLRISKEQFVSKKRAQFNVTDTDAAIDRVCVGDYVAISRVNNFGIFPYAGFTWNSFLLEHYVYAYSKDYRLLNAGFHKTECASAIVKRSIGIDNLDDFIVLLLTDADVELEKAPVLQFLVDNGYLARRRYTNIEKLIIRARAQRNRKETD